MLELFDTHTHLDASEFDEDREDCISRAQAAGVSRFVSIGAGYGIESADRAIAISEKYDFIWASAGIHPHDAEVDIDIDIIRKKILHERVVAVGETGLDFFRDWSPKEDQYRWFHAQVKLALEVDKPLIIHSREAGQECLAVLKEHGADRVGGVFHCYSENVEFAQTLKEMNFMISIPGTVTFKKADTLRDVVKMTPLNQIMLETDAPYMSPVPYRGKRCESAFMLETAKKIAEVKEISLEEVAEKTTENALRFYKIAK